ncbi:MAG TPA: hypothetical protein VFK15_13495, partial [Burkholderiales bacterium]|nr:hypothetical protein [Burkholderiales bacterium]
YAYNRFQACRYGCEGALVDAYAGHPVAIRNDILDTMERIAPHARELGADEALRELRDDVREAREDAAWLREQYRNHGSLNDVARLQSALWMGMEETVIATPIGNAS